MLIPITSNGEFLSVVSNYNTLLDDDDTYYLTFNEVIPGVNGQGTNFFTYNEETQTPELVEHVWIPRTWQIGGNQTYDYIGQDCAGEIWGLAEWDDCALCTGGNTSFDYNYYLDCAGVCFGDSELDDFGGCCTPNEDGEFQTWWFDGDEDGLGETSGATLEECDALGGYFDEGLCTASACYMPEGFADNDLDLDLDCDGVLDDCQICQGNSICFGEVIDGQCNSDSNWEAEGSAFDCTGLCNGQAFQLDWYADCDFDGMADHQNEVTVCGIEMPSEGDETYELLCSGGGNIISVNPNNHTFDPHPDCTSNQVDVCGTVMALVQIVEKLALLNHLYLSNCPQDDYGWGPEFSLAIEPLYTTSVQDTVVFIQEGCRPYIGYSSRFCYAHNNGVDICGQCSVKNLFRCYATISYKTILVLGVQMKHADTHDDITF